MKTIYIYFIILLVATMLCRCGDNEKSRQLEQIGKIADNNPDSALAMLDKYKHEKEKWSKDDRMHYELFKMKAENKADTVFKSDSTIKRILPYFKSNGTANEQALAYYLLGRVYSDMGEAPQALQAYYDAIEQADTTSKDCDYNTLYGIYGQMSRIFHKQNLPYDEIWAMRNYIECIRRTQNKEEYIAAKQHIISPYYLLGKKDTVLQIINDTYSSLKQMGKDREAADNIAVSIYIYIEKGELSKAKQAMDIFEKESGLFDENGNIAEGREHYYVTKGFYELAVGNITSAEYYFRKTISFGYISDGYKGLLDVYRQKGVLDSVVCFSKMYEAAQDSLHNEMQIDAIHRMSQLYNYTRSQKEAEQAKMKAKNTQILVAGILIVVVLVTMLVFYFYRQSQRKKQEEIRQLDNALASATKEYQDTKEELQKLKNKDYDKLIAEKERKEKELRLTIENLIGTSEISTTVDSLADFEKSKIVEVFHMKKDFRQGTAAPNKTEWRALEMQFSKNLPTIYKILINDKKLSPLELHICILLLLGFEDSSLVYLTDSIPQTITTAKSRANKKIFNAKGAKTLKAGLFQLIKELRLILI